MSIFKEGFGKLKKEYHERHEKAKHEKEEYMAEYNRARRAGTLSRARAEGFKAGRSKPKSFLDKLDTGMKSLDGLEKGWGMDSLFGAEPKHHKKRKHK